MRRLIIIGCIFVSFITCIKEYANPIPSLRVYLEVNLNDRDKELIGHNTYKIFTLNNTVHGKESTGFAGVLVTRLINGDYKAFDLACPNEARRDAIVEIGEDRNAVCKICGSKYEVILNYGSGMCISGPSKYPLRYYHTELRDKILIVRNILYY